jgi:hypothetical protein
LLFPCCVANTSSQAQEREKYILGLQSDFAMLGESGAGSTLRYEYWLGKVCRIIAVYSNRRKVEWRDPIDLQDLPSSPPEVHVIAQWYKKKDASTRQGPLYTLSDLSDYTLYNVKHIIVPLQLKMRQEQTIDNGVTTDAIFELDDVDKRALEQHVKDMTMQQAGRSTEGQKGKGKAKRKQASDVRGAEGVHSEDAGKEAVSFGYDRVAGKSSRSGRQTTKTVRSG